MPTHTERTPRFDFVVAANRLPVDRVPTESGDVEYRQSPGGLVSAMDPVMQANRGAWIGWDGHTGEAPEAFEHAGIWLEPIGLSAQEVREYYEGFSNDTLWPIYHDVIVPPSFHRAWFRAYRAVNERFAEAICRIADDGATVWVHDYQLQLVPALVRERRPDLRIGWFDHIPFPPVELFAQLPWRGTILKGLLGADFLGFQRTADAENFIRACRRLIGARTQRDQIRVTVKDEDGTERERVARAASVPISIDAGSLAELAATPAVQERARQLRADLGNPRTILLGVDRLDYTKGIRHRIKAYQELLDEGRLGTPDATLVQVATPSRERVEAYRTLREQIEGMVGHINGTASHIGHTPLHYLHQSYPREEMAALFVAADVMLVTPLRDGMNLVAKEYITCRLEDTGSLVLSEFTGAAHELKQAHLVNPHDTQTLKDTIMAAVNATPQEQIRRMRPMRKRVASHDVQTWARTFLTALEHAPDTPPRDAGSESAASR